jgi:hypothetical protein
MEPTRQILEKYNRIAAQLGRPIVKKFSDRKTAERRLAAIEAELPPVQTPVAEKRVRKPVFRFTPQAAAVRKRSNTSLRARCEDLLSRPDGAVFTEIEALVEEFDRERNKPSVNVKRRAYELVRIMHYQFGHGLDDRNGRLRLVTAQVRLPGVE